mgnify:CR=1 FL=1
MAEQIISPGVFTRENDQSFLPQGVGAIGAAIVGPTVKGPAFVPTVVRSFAEYEKMFGSFSSETFVPQTVREYLRNAGSVTVTRVLGGGGYTFTENTNEFIAVLASGSADGVLLGVILPSKNTAAKPTLQLSTLTLGIDGSSTTGGLITATNFDLSLGGANVTDEVFQSQSIDPTSNSYIFKSLGDSPDNSKTSAVAYSGTPGYTYINFKNLTKNIVSKDHMTGSNALHMDENAFDATHGYTTINSGSTAFLSTQDAPLVFAGLSGQEEGYSYASTPFIQSGKANGSKALFKFHTLAHGTSTNKEYKISISGLREPADIDGEEQYSTFNVLVRKYNDTDKSPNVLEQYNGVNLDPDSSQYIARVIGDRYPQYNDTLGKVELLGNYSNISNYVRVEVDAAVDAKSTSPKLSPKGFAAVTNPIAMAAIELAAAFPSASYEGLQQTGISKTYNSKGYLGWKFKEKEADNENFLLPLPTTEETNIAGAFNVENYNGHASSSLWSGSLSANIDPTGNTGPTSNQLKFTVPFQGGDDGIAPHTVRFTGAESGIDEVAAYTDGDNLYGFDLSLTTGGGYKGYKKAIDILSNQDEYDINMLALPGVIHSKHSLVTNAAIDMVEARGDAFYVMDTSIATATVNQAVSDVSGLDTNYAATYYPWVKVLDTAQNKPVLVPPSVIVPGAIAASDRIAAEWFAPAGLNRGVLGNVIEAKIRLNQAERDTLYNDKINPIATFPQTGVCIWGQKTLQSRSTALDRINVRRLLIALKKFIASSSRYLVFEQNTNATRNRFLNIVNPYLEGVQQKQGLYSFRVQMDENNNTADVVDRNQLVGAVYLQPTKTAEFIVLDFNVLPTGATFE